MKRSTMDPAADLAVPHDLVGLLVSWFRRSAREMPWRRTRDPYAIWISEVMLQQTTVAVATGYYARFLEAFPTVRALAEAPVDEVMARWSGLGYYSRAKNLHRAAQVVVGQHGGRLPADLESLKSLPGVGPYTAGAVASIAHGLAAPVVDGNVARVLSRLFGLTDDPRGTVAARRLWALAGRLVPVESPGDFNQALMELGATVCSPRSPSCASCPLSRSCVAFRERTQDQIPPPRKTVSPVEQTWVVALLQRGDAILMLKPRRRGLLQDIWELPGGVVPEGAEARSWLADHLATLLGCTLHVGPKVARVKHSIMNRRISVEIHRVDLAPGARPSIDPGTADHRWLPRTEFEGLALSSMTTKVLAKV